MFQLLLAPARTLIKKFHDPVFLFENIADRKIPQSIDIDIYCCGFPCQPFSKAGKGLGPHDARGTIISHVIDFLSQHTPRAFILENVPALATTFKPFFESIMHALRSIRDSSYTVSWQVLEARAYGGLPQKRKRVFIVGICKHAQVNEFQFPPPLDTHQQLTLTDVLDHRIKLCGLDGVGGTARKNIKSMESELRKQGINANRTDIILDTGGSKPHWTYDACPTITATRGSQRAFWSTKRGRFLSVEELARLQGVPDDLFDGWREVLSESQMGHIVGNAMCVALLSRLVRHVLLAIGRPTAY